MLWSRNGFATKRREAAVRRLVDRGVQHYRRARGRPAHNHHRVQEWIPDWTKLVNLLKTAERLNPITDGQ